MEGKPDWKTAPLWAEFLAMDADGDWYWYEKEPSSGGSSFNAQASTHVRFANSSETEWQNTLEKRPS